MTKTVDAIYEDGIFKPIDPINIPEHKRVTLIIEEKQQESADILSLAANVYSGLSSQNIEAVEELAIDRSNFSRNGS